MAVPPIPDDLFKHFDDDPVTVQAALLILYPNRRQEVVHCVQSPRLLEAVQKLCTESPQVPYYIPADWLGKTLKELIDDLGFLTHDVCESYRLLEITGALERLGPHGSEDASTAIPDTLLQLPANTLCEYGADKAFDPADWVGKTINEMISDLGFSGWTPISPPDPTPRWELKAERESGS